MGGWAGGVTTVRDSEHSEEAKVDPRPGRVKRGLRSAWAWSGTSCAWSLPYRPYDSRSLLPTFAFLMANHLLSPPLSTRDLRISTLLLTSAIGHLRFISKLKLPLTMPHEDLARRSPFIDKSTRKHDGILGLFHYSIRHLAKEHATTSQRRQTLSFQTSTTLRGVRCRQGSSKKWPIQWVAEV
jgi:hypothetical protein